MQIKTWHQRAFRFFHLRLQHVIPGNNQHYSLPTGTVMSEALKQKIINFFQMVLRHFVRFVS